MAFARRRAVPSSAVLAPLPPFKCQRYRDIRRVLSTAVGTFDVLHQPAAAAQGRFQLPWYS